jgi:spore coat protein CotH
MTRSRTLLLETLLASCLVIVGCGGQDPTSPTTAIDASTSSGTSQEAPTTGGLYDEAVLRTIYLEFSQADWWSQLQRNYAAAENIPADLTIDGVLYPDVGVRFRGTTSYRNTGNSPKKSFNIEVNDTHPDQRVMGYRTLNLNNAYNDPSFIREVLYFNLARRYIPTARANFVLLVINGESWGVYANIQQINREFIEEWFPSSDGTRWRAGDGFGGGPGGMPGGGPGGGAGGGFSGGASALTWLGSDQAAYEAAYDVRTNDTPQGWAGLIAACDVLNNTTLEELASSANQAIDVERSLWYLAVENTFVDEDGYLFKGADYYLYWEPETGRLHPIQHDGNEVLGAAARLGPTSWTPTQGDADPSRPLISRLLSVPAFRESYLSHMRSLANDALDLAALEPKIEEYRSLIRDEVMVDSKKLYSNADFESSIEDIKSFIESRRAFLLARPELN